VISVADLDAIVQARLEDAKVLLSNGRIDGANYVCGFAVEVALKARICRTLNWPAFPEKRHEFENLSSRKTHRLDVLLGAFWPGRPHPEREFRRMVGRCHLGSRGEVHEGRTSGYG
jgi:hypothetical protein